MKSYLENAISLTQAAVGRMALESIGYHFYSGQHEAYKTVLRQVEALINQPPDDKASR